jgi:hypothetical protein
MYVRLHYRSSGKNPVGYRSGNRWISSAYSLLLHAGVVLLLFLPWSSGPDRPLYNSIVVPLETQHKIIYYSFHDRLPEVSPTNPDAAHTEPDRAALKAPQKIVTAPREKPGKQFVWIPAPKVKLQTEVRAPNVISFQPPAIPAPERPKPKAFQAPQERTAQPPAAVAALEAAPRLADSTNEKSTSLDQLTKPVAAPRRDFVMPQAPTGSGTAKPPSLDSVPAPPSVQEGVQTAGANLAIIGLSPANTPHIPQPEGASAANVSAGPQVSTNARGQLGNGNSAIRIPDVSIEGKPADTASIATRGLLHGVPVQPGIAVPRMPAPIRAFDSPHVSVPQWPNNRTLPAPIEQHFQNRVVYMTVMAGQQAETDWVVWFGEQAATPATTRPVMRPPSLAQPAALPPVPARNEHGAGKLRISGVIRKDGHLDSCSGLAESASPELVAALQRWLFKPATRNGDAVDVDAVIEIPVSFMSASTR